MNSDRSLPDLDPTWDRGEPGAGSERNPATLSTREAAAALGLGEHAVRQAIASGVLAAVRQGRVYRIRHDDLRRFARRQGLEVAEPRGRIVALPTPAAVPTLPTPASRFVGRVAELAALTALLNDPAERLITVTGPGGIGKTRLALAAATAARDRFPDGVHLVDLAPIARPQFVIPAIAQALGLREHGRQERRAQLAAFLSGKRVLLVLDNFEQILGAGPDVAWLVAHAPGVSALITSRAPLRVGGERELPAPPLSLPGVEATPGDVLASDAGKLFVERAREHDPGFVVDADSAPHIADICARLDGIPLAIELAAALSRILPPRLLRDRLERRLLLLTHGARDAPARLRTMRDAIAWSYDLLAPREQRHFRRLAVFAGGCTLEAAAAVLRLDAAGPGDDPTADVLEPIGALLDQSLLARERGPVGEPRFRMLETIREYGLERLEADEEAAARSAHAQYFLRFAQALRPLSNTLATRAPHDRLAADDANLLAALDLLEDQGQHADVAAMVAACWVYWYASGQLHEAEGWLARTLSRLDAASEPDRARLLIAHAELLMIKGESEAAEAAFARGLPFVRRVGDPLDLAEALISRGASLCHGGQYVEAEGCLVEAISVAETIPDPKLRAAFVGGALSNLIDSASGRGNLSLAAEHGEEALRRYHGQDLDLAEARVLVDLGEVATQQGNHRVAVDHYLAYVKQFGERGEMRVVSVALAGIANAATAWGHRRPALLLYGAAEALRERVGVGMILPTEASLETRDRATLHTTMDDREFEATLAEGRALPLSEALSLAAAVTPSGSGMPVSRADSRKQLTRREREILAMLAESLTDREIGEALFLSPRTVNWHVRGILAKLGVASRREATARASAEGWLTST